MSTDLMVRPGGALAVGADQTEWSEQQLAVLRSVGVNEQVTPAELNLFLHECQRTGLDPFSKQIYLIGRWDGRAGRDVFRSQTGIDGYRVVAHRAARRDGVSLGYSETQWCGPDGAWRDVWLAERPPAAAKVVVYRGGDAFPAVATLAEYAATNKKGEPTPMWRRMPATMLAKCAEALALRKAFPHDLAGIYTDEEMGQADNETRQPVQLREPQPAVPRRAERSRGQVEDEFTSAPADPVADAQDDEWSRPVESGSGLPATVPQLKALATLITKKAGPMTDEARLARLSHFTRREITSSKQLTKDEASRLIDWLGQQPDFVLREEQVVEAAEALAEVAVPLAEHVEEKLRDLVESAGDPKALEAAIGTAFDAEADGQIDAEALARLQQAATVRKKSLAELAKAALQRRAEQKAAAGQAAA